jgi:hypothetical protein
MQQHFFTLIIITVTLKIRFVKSARGSPSNDQKEARTEKELKLLNNEDDNDDDDDDDEGKSGHLAHGMCAVYENVNSRERAKRDKRRKHKKVIVVKSEKPISIKAKLIANASNFNEIKK